MCAGGHTRSGRRRELQRRAALTWLILAAGYTADIDSRALAQTSPAAPRQPQPERVELTKRAVAPAGAVTVGAPAADEPAAFRVPSRRRRPQPAPAAPRVRLPLNIQGAEGAVNDKRFEVTEGAAEIKTNARGDTTIELPREGRTVVTSDQASKSAILSRIVQQTKTALPWLVLDTRETQQGTSVLATRPFLQLARAILWDEKSKRHIAELMFGVDPEPGHPNDTVLEPPFRARFAVSCDEVSPAEAEISRVGPGGYSTVRVACSAAVKNERPDQYIEIHVGSGNLRYSFELPHRPGPPLLIASATSLAGLGIGSTTLTVKRIEEDGSPLTASQPLTIQLLAAGGGTLEPSTIALPAGQREASVEVRPAGLGTVAVSAVIGELQSQPVRLHLHWPWFAMVAMLAGALAGAFLGYVRSRRKHSFRRTAADVLSGVLVAAATLIVPALVTLPSWTRLTELYFFVIAALAAFLGLDAFEALARRLFPGVPRPPSKNASPVAK